MQSRVWHSLTLLLTAAAVLGGGWLTLRFLLPWSAPFLLALALAALMEPLVRRLVALRWRRRAAAGVVSLGFLALLLALIIRGGGRLAAGAVRLGRQLPELMLHLSRGAQKLEEEILLRAAGKSPALESLMGSTLEALGEALYTVPATLSQWLLDLLGRIAQRGPDVLLFAVTAGIGSYFVSASYPQTLAFLAAQVPAGWKSRLAGLGRDLRAGFGGLLRAQLLLMGLCFFVLVLLFFVLQVKNALLLAALTAALDALPVFGTGLVLLPWAFYCLLLGQSRRGLGLLLGWALVNLLRSCAQAKLMGDQMGLNPLASLLAVYVGWQVRGVWGMLLFPVLLVVLQQLNDKGLLRLWKSI